MTARSDLLEREETNGGDGEYSHLPENRGSELKLTGLTEMGDDTWLIGWRVSSGDRSAMTF